MKYDLDLDINENTSHALMLKRVKPGSKVLEFGSASGYMTKYMKEQLKCNVTCIEIDAEAAYKGRGFSEKMIVANIEDLNTWSNEVSESRFDYILFADVLEHLRNPDEVLRRAVTFLDTNGTIMTSVPNIAHNSVIMELLQGRFDYRPTGLLDDTHVHFFTKKSILELLAKCDLKPIEWLSTMRRPESTEFEQKYEHFPAALSNFLEEREDGDVYQFITISKYKHESHQDVSIDKRDSQNYLDADHCQIYLRKDGIFDEVNSLLEKIQYDNELRIIQFSLPEDYREEEIRIDPCNSQAIIRIKYIRIYNNQGELLFNCDMNNGFDGILSKNNMYLLDGKEELRLLSINNDPGILLHLPGITKSQGLSLEIEMSVNNNKEYILELLTHESEQLKKEVFSKKQMLTSKDSLINELNHKCEELCRNNEMLLNDIEQTNDEIKDVKEKLYTEREKFLENICKLEDDLLSAERNLQETNHKLSQILNSKSWRATSIFRYLANKRKSIK